MCLPIISLMCNSDINPFPTDIVQHFIERLPSSSWDTSSIFSGNVLHAACSNENITLEAMQQLLNIEGNMVRSIGTLKDTLPIHVLAMMYNCTVPPNPECINIFPNWPTRAEKGWPMSHRAVVVGR